MPHIVQTNRLVMFLLVGTIGAGMVGFLPLANAKTSDTLQESAALREAPSPAKPKLDLSGRKRVGKASFYAKKFAGRKMADGTIMKPQSDNAASKTLPLGTIAKVTNLKTGQSAVVTIQDRGPYVKGRIVDVSPAPADKLGIKREGVARVEVAPIVVPLPDGSVKLGVAAQEAKSDTLASGDLGG